MPAKVVLRTHRLFYFGFLGKFLKDIILAENDRQQCAWKEFQIKV
jgi:hypothetical protein